MAEAGARGSSGLSTERKVQVGFALALICLAGIGIMSSRSVSRLREDGKKERHTEEVISSLRLLLSTATDAETAQRGYVITGDELFLKPYDEARARVGQHLDALKRLTADDPAQQHRLERLGPLIAERMAVTVVNVELRRSEDFAAAQAAVATARGKTLHDRIRAQVAEMEAAERERLKEREAHAERSSRLAKLIISCGSVLALVSVGVALWLISRDLAGSRRAQEALREANERLEARVVERTAELQRERAQLQLILDTVPALIFFKDREHRLFRVNAELARLLGRPKAEIEGLTDAELGTPEAARYARDEDEILRTGEPKQNFIEPLVTEGKGVRWLQTDKIPLRNERGEIVGIVGFAVDITERRAAEEARARLAQLIEHSRDFIGTANLDGRVTFLNLGGRRMIGLPDDADPGELHFTDYVPEEWRDFFVNTVIPTARAQGSWEGEMQLRHMPTGTLVDVLRSTFLLREADGQPSSFATVTRDITPAKRAERALHRSEERLRLAVTGAGLGTWHWDLEKGTLDWSDTCRAIFGIPPDEPMSYERFLEALHPDDHERTSEEVRWALETHSEYAIEYRAVWPDGNTRWIAAKGRGEYNAAGKPVRMEGVVLDITAAKQAELALRESEARLRLVLQAAQIGDWEMDPITQEGWCSDLHYQILGYREPPTQWNLAIFLGHVSVPERARVERIIRDGLERERDWRFECQITRSDGETRWIAVLGRFFHELGGRPVRVLGIVEDITERRMADEEIRGQLDELLRWQAVTIGRESRMLELKGEVNELLGAQGQPRRYTDPVSG